MCRGEMIRIVMLMGVCTVLLSGCAQPLLNQQTEPAAELSSSASAHQVPLHVDVTTHLGDGFTFVEGDALSFLVSLNQDAFLLLVYEDVNRNLAQIYPNSRGNDGFHKAGHYFPMPGEDSQFVVTAPHGSQTLWVFATTTPPAELAKRKPTSQVVVLDETLDSIRDALRGDSTTAAGQYGEAKMTFETVPK